MSISVNLPDELGSRLVAAAQGRDITVDELAAELLAEQLPDRPHLARFLGMGASSSGRNADEDEDMLAEGFGR